MVKQKGLTLFELLIALAVVAILYTVVMPNITGTVYRNQVVSDINETSNALQYGRFNAVDTQLNAVVCPSNDYETCDTSNWTLPKIVFIDVNNNGNRDNDEELLFTTQSSGKNIITGPNSNIVFDGSGTTQSEATILICARNGDIKLAREIHIGANGRIRLSKDTDGDGISEGADGSNLSC
ncbi:MAG: GspH/FimT family pseudopilin [Pseudomonadota bacterium]